MCRKLFLLISFVLVFGVVAGSVASAAAVPADANLVAYYKLDESVGYIAGDISGNDDDHDGRLWDIAHVEWVPAGGKIGGAALFYDTEDTNDEILIAMHPDEVDYPDAVVMKPEAGTIAMWVYPTLPFPTWDFPHFFGHKNALGNRVKLMRRDTIFCVQMGDKFYWSCGSMDPANTWYHVAITWDQNDLDPNDGKLYAYLDGSRTSQQGANPYCTYKDLKEFSDFGTIGNNGSQERPRDESWVGYIDDVSLWNRVLTELQINDLKDSGISGLDFDIATEPMPGRDALRVDVATVLGWTPGVTGDPNHDVYFGTDYDDVYYATRDEPCGVLLSINWESCSYDPCDVAGAGGAPNDPTFLVLGREYFWRIDEVNDSNLPQWEGKVWGFTTDDGIVRQPNPRNNDDPPVNRRVLSTYVLRWVKGQFVTTNGHILYLGTNEQDVNTSTYGTGDYKATLNADNYPCSGDDLLANEVYYWRVDQNNPTGIPTSKGPVWGFKRLPDIILDDFEDYDNSADLQAVWTVATGQEPTLDDDEASEGQQSMKYIYCYPPLTNTEVVLNSANGLRADWSIGGRMQAFGLYYMFPQLAGAPGPYEPSEMYVKITDTAANGVETATVTASGNDPNADGEWHSLDIDYQEFEADNPDIDMNCIEELAIGFTDVQTYQEYMYIDYVAIYAPRFISDKRQADGDVYIINRMDGEVDGRDLDELFDDWMDSGDYNTIGYDGILHGSLDWDAGGHNGTGCLYLRKATQDWVDVDDYALGNFCEVTIAMWVKRKDPMLPHPLGYSWRARLFEADNDYMGVEISVDGGDCRGGWEGLLRARLNDVKYPFHTQKDISHGTGTWHHVAFVINEWIDDEQKLAGAEREIIAGSLYFDGVRDVSNAWKENANKGGALITTGRLGGDPVHPARHSQPSLEGAHLSGDSGHDNCFIDWKVDDFIVFDYNMVKDDVEDLFNGVMSKASIKASALVWYDFNDGSGNIAKDTGKDETNDLYHSTISPGNLYDEEEQLSKNVNFKDYAVVAQDWLVREVWPDTAMEKNCLYKVTNIVNTPPTYDKCPRFMDDMCHKSGTCTDLTGCTDSFVHVYTGTGGSCTVTFSEMDCLATKARMCP